MAYEYPRHAYELVDQALGYARVVLVLGPRQSGKSTLAGQLVSRNRLNQIVSLDEPDTLATALEDPTGLIGALRDPVAIDEVQRAPDLLLAIKRAVDSSDEPGRFLLTGSANIFTSPKILDALTGRMDTIHLWPLAKDEVDRRRELNEANNLIDALFDSDPPQLIDAPIGTDAWLEDAILGGFPEVRSRPAGRPREQWFDNYLRAITERDLSDLSQARRLSEVPALIEALAANVGSPLVTSRIAQRMAAAQGTVRDYIRLLETAFVIRMLPAWRPGLSARERKAGKPLFVDTGLLAHVLGADADKVAKKPDLAGPLFENFATMEVLKQLEWSELHGAASHYRRDGREVDLVIERRSGEFIAIEFKASATVGAADRRALTELRDARPEDFKAGAVIHTGPNTRPLGDRIWALPVSALWSP